MEVKQTIHTPAVLAAFERAKLSNLPEEVMSSYKEEDARLKNLSGHIAQTRAEGKEEGKEEARREIARNLLKNGVEISVIAAATSLSREEISSLLP